MPVNEGQARIAPHGIGPYRDCSLPASSCQSDSPFSWRAPHANPLRSANTDTNTYSYADSNIHCNPAAYSHAGEPVTAGQALPWARTYMD